MEERILEILENLLKHEITKNDAKNQLLILSNIGNIEHRIVGALNASVKAIYFSDSSDYRSYHYQVIHSLTQLDDVSENDINYLFNQLNPE